MVQNITHTGGATFPTTSAGSESPYEPAVLLTANDGDRHIPAVHIHGPQTAFGELKVAEKTPQVQIKFLYNIVHPDVGQILTNKSGSSVTVANGQATVTCSSTAEAFSQIRTLDTLRYGPGQGAEFLGTCAFTTGVANSSQVFGPGDDDEGFFFGYDGTDFGVMRRSGGNLEIKSITIDAAATNAGTITVTLDDTAVPVEVGAGDTIPEVVEKIINEAGAFFDAGRGWEVRTDDDNSIEFISLVAETAGGTFSFVDTDSTGVTATGGFTTAVTGVAPTESWIKQEDWNKDRVNGGAAHSTDGTTLNPSGVTLDTTKGNVYRIQFQYLGYGAIKFSIEDPNSGEFIVVHDMEYTNRHTTPTLVNPTLHLNLIVKTEAGYTGGALIMNTASMAGFIEGKETNIGVRRAVSATKGMDTTRQNALTIHNEIDFNSHKNKVSVYPDFMTIASESTKTTVFTVIRNPSRINGGTALIDVETNVSTMQYTTDGTTVVDGEELFVFTLSGAGFQKKLI